MMQHSDALIQEPAPGSKSPDVADALVLTFAGGLNDRPAREKKYERYSKYKSGQKSWMAY